MLIRENVVGKVSHSLTSGCWLVGVGIRVIMAIESGW